MAKFACEILEFIMVSLSLPLNQSHSELWAAEDNDGSRATSLLITAPNKPEQQGESGVYVEIPHSASLEESQCLTEKPLRLKKKKKEKQPILA